MGPSSSIDESKLDGLADAVRRRLGLNRSLSGPSAPIPVLLRGSEREVARLSFLGTAADGLSWHAAIANTKDFGTPVLALLKLRTKIDEETIAASGASSLVLFDHARIGMLGNDGSIFPLTKSTSWIEAEHSRPLKDTRFETLTTEDLPDPSTLLPDQPSLAAFFEAERRTLDLTGFTDPREDSIGTAAHERYDAAVRRLTGLKIPTLRPMVQPMPITPTIQPQRYLCAPAVGEMVLLFHRDHHGMLQAEGATFEQGAIAGVMGSKTGRGTDFTSEKTAYESLSDQSLWVYPKGPLPLQYVQKYLLDWMIEKWSPVRLGNSATHVVLMVNCSPSDDSLLPWIQIYDPLMTVEKSEQNWIPITVLPVKSWLRFKVNSERIQKITS